MFRPAMLNHLVVLDAAEIAFHNTAAIIIWTRALDFNDVTSRILVGSNDNVPSHLIHILRFESTSDHHATMRNSTFGVGYVLL